MKKETHINIREIKGAEILDFLSCSALSKRFFNRSRAWFTQRLNNNIVNGKPISFTQIELIKLCLSLREISNEIKKFCDNIDQIEHRVIDSTDSAIEDGIKIVGGYNNYHLGVKVFQNEDNTFEALGYYCYHKEVDWYPWGDAEASNHFSTEDEAVEFAINILKEQIDFWKERDKYRL